MRLASSIASTLVTITAIGLVVFIMSIMVSSANRLHVSNIAETNYDQTTSHA